nr:MAG TPA: hypothetical protein [Caudoviricetes sp.]
MFIYEFSYFYLKILSLHGNIIIKEVKNGTNRR